MTVESGRDVPVVVLIGFMGAGKSTVGAALAELLGVDFLDTDHEIVRRSGRAVEEIFAGEGEAHFRRLEAEVVADVLESHRGVVALGGGAVLTAAVRDALRGHHVVHLAVTADGGFARVHGSTRPLLRGDGTDGRSPRERYAALHSERAAIYRDTATVEIDTVGADAVTVAQRIVERIAPSHLPPSRLSPSAPEDPHPAPREARP